MNIADEAEAKKANQKIEDMRRQELNDIRTVLSNAAGKRLLWRMLTKCHSFESIYAVNQNDVYYNSGQQDIGHFIMGEIMQADPNLFMKMMKDNNKKSEGK